MMSTPLLHCDGCGQLASPEHIAKRLQRLEWTTRYRPVHIGTLLLGAAAPGSDNEFLYAPEGAFAGQAGTLLAAAGVSSSGKSAEATLAEFQRGGFLLTYVLDCAFDQRPGDETALQAQLSARLPALAARVRRSLRPKKLAVISESLGPIVSLLESIDLGCPIVLDGGKPFALDGSHDGSDGEHGLARKQSAERLRQALATNTAAAR